MTTKHKPATPLPWHNEYQPTGDGRIAGNYVVAKVPAVAYMAPQGTRDAESANAAYIAHAANAYPRLVAALRWFVTCKGTPDFDGEIGRSLLRELDE